MTERLLERIDRLGAAAGISTMTPEIRRFAMLVRDDMLSGWPGKPWVGLTDDDREAAMDGTYDRWDIAEAIEAKLREKNT